MDRRLLTVGAAVLMAATLSTCRASPSANHAEIHVTGAATASYEGAMVAGNPGWTGEDVRPAALSCEFGGSSSQVTLGFSDGGHWWMLVWRTTFDSILGVEGTVIVGTSRGAFRVSGLDVGATLDYKNSHLQLDLAVTGLRELVGSGSELSPGSAEVAVTAKVDANC